MSVTLKAFRKMNSQKNKIPTHLEKNPKVAAKSQERFYMTPKGVAPLKMRPTDRHTIKL